MHHPTLPTARTGSHPRDTARDALTAGTAPPDLLTLAAACRGLRLRGCTPAEAAMMVAAASKVTDGQTMLGVFDHAWGVGDPAAPAEEEARNAMPEIDVADLFGGSPICAEMAKWCAGDVVCGPDLPVLTMLALFSAAVACKAIGDCGGWTNPPSLFLAVEVASGENKTRVRKLCGGRMLTAHAMGAVADWHDILNAAHGQRMIAARFDKKTKEAQIVKYKNDPVAVAEFTAELYAIETELKRKSITTPGWLQEGKITPAQYIREMQLGGFIAAMPDEGKETLWEFVGGEGKKSGDLAPLLCAFSGEPCTNATIAGEQRGDLRRFHDFRATMWLPLQPGVLTPTTPEDGRMLANLGERGLLARLLIARPRPVRSEEAPSVREAHAREFGHPDVVETIAAPTGPFWPPCCMVSARSRRMATGSRIGARRRCSSARPTRSCRHARGCSPTRPTRWRCCWTTRSARATRPRSAAPTRSRCSPSSCRASPTTRTVWPPCSPSCARAGLRAVGT